MSVTWWCCWGSDFWTCCKVWSHFWLVKWIISIFLIIENQYAILLRLKARCKLKIWPKVGILVTWSRKMKNRSINCWPERFCTILAILFFEWLEKFCTQLNYWLIFVPKRPVLSIIYSLFWNINKNIVNLSRKTYLAAQKSTESLRMWTKATNFSFFCWKKIVVMIRVRFLWCFINLWRTKLILFIARQLRFLLPMINEWLELKFVSYL